MLFKFTGTHTYQHVEHKGFHNPIKSPRIFRDFLMVPIISKTGPLEQVKLVTFLCIYI